MRKVLFLFMLLLTGINIFGINPKAQNQNLLPNMIELKSLSFNDGSYIITQDIVIESSKTYTLFIGNEIYGLENQYKPSGINALIEFHFGIEIETFASTQNQDGHYVELSVQHNTITKIIIKTTNQDSSSYPKIMFYEGSFNLFRGFSNYSEGSQELKEDEKWTFLVTKHSPITIETFLSKLTVMYGDEPTQIHVISENYTRNSQRYGEYEVWVLIKDLNNNVIKKQLFYIKVVDDIPFTIEGPDELEVTRGQDRYLEYIINFYFETDDDPVDRTVIFDANEVDIDRVGTYPITLRAWDYLGQEHTRVVQIHVVDKVKPTINKHAEIIYTYTDNEPFSQEEILAYFTILDDGPIEELDITLDNLQDYQSNHQLEKDHLITVKVTDASGNEASSQIIIRVVKRNSLVITIDDRFFLTLDEANTMDLYEIKQWFQDQLNDNGITAENIEMVFSDYEVISKPGRYSMIFTYDTNENSFREKIVIDIQETNTTGLNTLHWSLIIGFSLLLTILIPTTIIYYKKKRRITS